MSHKRWTNGAGTSWLWLSGIHTARWENRTVSFHPSLCCRSDRGVVLGKSWALKTFDPTLKSWNPLWWVTKSLKPFSSSFTSRCAPTNLRQALSLVAFHVWITFLRDIRVSRKIFNKSYMQLKRIMNLTCVNCDCFEFNAQFPEASNFQWDMHRHMQHVNFPGNDDISRGLL